MYKRYTECSIVSLVFGAIKGPAGSMIPMYIFVERQCVREYFRLECAPTEQVFVSAAGG